MEPTPAPLPESTAREIAKALGLVFGATGILAVIQAIAPWTASWMQVALAIVLIQAPSWVLRRGAAAERAIGMRIGPIGSELRAGLLTMCVVFPLFVAGYHVLHTEFMDFQADWSVAHLARWDEDLERAPPLPCGRAATVTAWTVRDMLWVTPPPMAELTLDVRIDGAVPPAGLPVRRLICDVGEGPRLGPSIRHDAGRITLGKGQGAWILVGPRDSLRVTVTDRGTLVPAHRIARGAGGATASEDGVIDAERSVLWLLSFIVVHLGLVALPEEWFFRGYLQGRIDQALGTPWRLLGVQVGWGLILGAAAFALLHPILLPGAHRLMVFFPALLFGWLRARGGSLGAAIVVHAGSNVLIAIVSRMY